MANLNESLMMEEIEEVAYGNEKDLITEILFVAQGEDWSLCQEGNRDCMWHELELQLIPAGRAEFNNHWPDNLNQKDANKKARFTMYRH
jgi:hypothetical protein